MRGIQFELCEVPCLLNHGKSGRPTTTGSPFFAGLHYAVDAQRSNDQGNNSFNNTYQGTCFFHWRHLWE